MTKTLRDIQNDASLLHGLLEGIDHLDNEGHANARTALIRVAYDVAGKLADDLDRLKCGEGDDRP